MVKDLTIKVYKATEDKSAYAEVFDINQKLILTAWPVTYKFEKYKFVLLMIENRGYYCWIDRNGTRWRYEFHEQVGETGHDAPLIDMLIEAGLELPGMK